MVEFSDLSTDGPTGWLSSFGDESATSTDQNPSFEYAANGTYLVSLTAMNVNGLETIVQADLIFVPEPAVLMQLAGGIACLTFLDSRRRRR